MSVITMCQVEDCPLKGTCYRAIAQPNYSQSYFKEDPRKDAWHRPSTCEYFFVEPVGIEKIVRHVQMSSGSLNLNNFNMGFRADFWNDPNLNGDIFNIQSLAERDPIFYRGGNTI